MRSTGVPIPTLDAPWPDALKIAVVTSSDARLGWRKFAHEVAATVQPGGHADGGFPAGFVPVCGHRRREKLGEEGGQAERGTKRGEGLVLSIRTIGEIYDCGVDEYRWL